MPAAVEAPEVLQMLFWKSVGVQKCLADEQTSENRVRLPPCRNGILGKASTDESRQIGMFMRTLTHHAVWLYRFQNTTFLYSNELRSHR